MFTHLLMPGLPPCSYLCHPLSRKPGVSLELIASVSKSSPSTMLVMGLVKTSLQTVIGTLVMASLLIPSPLPAHPPIAAGAIGRDLPRHCLKTFYISRCQISPTFLRNKFHSPQQKLYKNNFMKAKKSKAASTLLSFGLPHLGPWYT